MEEEGRKVNEEREGLRKDRTSTDISLRHWIQQTNMQYSRGKVFPRTRYGTSFLTTSTSS